MQFEKTYTREFFKDFNRLFSIVFEKLTRACFFQIALETILLHIQIIFKTFPNNIYVRPTRLCTDDLQDSKKRGCAVRFVHLRVFTRMRQNARNC